MHKMIRIIPLIAGLALWPIIVNGQAETDHPRLTERAQLRLNSTPVEQPGQYWLYLDDTGRSDSPISFSDRALDRRRKVSGTSIRFVATDYPPSSTVLERVRSTGATVRQVSRWLNAISVEASAAEMNKLLDVSVIQRVDLVGRYTKTWPQETLLDSKALRPEVGAAVDYGLSAFQNQFIRATKLHDAGLRGTGVLIALLDTGFDINHEAFDSTNILATWNFIDGIEPVDAIDCPGDILKWQQYFHGTLILGAIGANLPGELFGVAPGADYILAKTEITCGGTEIMIEEDNWVAAAEWADSAGADIISSSLGYSTFDDGGYTNDDMDGNTAVTTIAADIAASKNILIVVAAGNERRTSWGLISAPSDGDSVLAVGAANPDSSIASFSSPGPTADGRIKPDITTLGVGVWTALSGGGLTASGGTSLATPLVAGSAALIMEMYPSLMAQQVFDRLRQTGSRAENPDNDFGYGLLNVALAAELIRIEPVDDIRLTIYDTLIAAINTTGTSFGTPTLSAFNMPDFASFVDFADGSGELTLRGSPTNPVSSRIGIELDANLFFDTTFINVYTVANFAGSVSAGPNPFSDTLTIFFSPDLDPVQSVSIFNAAGELVWEKVNIPTASADTPIMWDGHNRGGERAASGVYLVNVRTERNELFVKVLKRD